MRGHSYLDQKIQQKVSNIADAALKKIGLIEPPVNYDVIYDKERLNKKIFTINELVSQGILKASQNKNITKIRGILLVKDKQVFVIDDTHYAKRHNFVLAHEFGHWILPHHKALLYKCTQFDLSKKARKQLEIEANYFASEFGFMGRVFFDYLKSSTLSISNIKTLSDTFELSIEATLRRSAEIHDIPCAFVSFVVNENDEKNFLKIRYAVLSEPFQKTYGKINPSSVFPKNHVLSKIITDPFIKLVGECECEISFGRKKLPMKAEVWKNPYNIFALIQPITNKTQ